MAQESLGVKAGRAALWQIVGGGWQTLIRLGASIYLARALRPSDFGLFGMALLYQEFFTHIFAMGFGSGIIVKKSLSQNDLNTCFWLSCLIRVAIFLILFISAPLAVYFWKEPRIEQVIRVISFTLIIQIIAIVPGILVVKKMEFKKLNILRGLSLFLESLTACLLVYYCHITYWALVIGMVGNSVIYNFSLWLWTGRWLPELKMDRESFRYLFRFGFFSWLSALVGYLRQNIDYFVIGRILGSYQLGLYEFAYRLPHIIHGRLAGAIAPVVFSLMSNISDENSLLDGYLKSVQHITFVCYPILFLLILIADILVPLLWGDQWLPIILPLRILCVSACLLTLFQSLNSIFICKGEPQISSYMFAVSLVFGLFFVLLFGYLWKMVGVAIAMVLSTIPSLYFLWYAFHKYFKASIYLFFLSILPVVIVNFFLLTLFFFIKSFFVVTFGNNLLVVLLLSIFYFACYLLILLTFFGAFVRKLFADYSQVFGFKLNIFYNFSTIFKA